MQHLSHEKQHKTQLTCIVHIIQCSHLRICVMHATQPLAITTRYKAWFEGYPLQDAVPACARPQVSAILHRATLDLASSSCLPSWKCIPIDLGFYLAHAVCYSLCWVLRTESKLNGFLSSANAKTKWINIYLTPQSMLRSNKVNKHIFNECDYGKLITSVRNISTTSPAL